MESKALAVKLTTILTVKKKSCCMEKSFFFKIDILFLVYSKSKSSNSVLKRKQRKSIYCVRDLDICC